MTLEENIERYFKGNKEPSFNFDSLVALVERVEILAGMKKKKTSLLEATAKPGENQSIELVWEGIPFLSADELGWGKASTSAGANPADSRQQIQRFLSQIGARRYDIKSKLRYLEAFFSKSEKTGASKQNLKRAGVNLDDPRQSIAKILSYLTFYKTLTMILQRFNASSAGFTFESFIAVLLGGEQIPTGSKTIADLTSKTGKPISLKLLDEKKNAVKGSFRELVNDLAGAGTTKKESMEYIVVLKDLEGEGTEVEGVIKFFRFYFTYDSILHYLGQMGGEKADYLRLPVAIVQGGEEEAIEGVLPFGEYFLEHFDEILNTTLETVAPPKEGWTESVGEAVLSGFEQDTGSMKLFNKGSREKLILDILGVESTPESRSAIVPYLQAQNGVRATLFDLYRELMSQHKAATKERKVAHKTVGNYASIEESLAYMNQVKQESGEDAFWDIMTKTYGYRSKGEWILYKSAIENEPPETKEQAYLGRLFIGSQAVEAMANMCRDVINDKVFEIFKELRILTDRLRAYFAEGMENQVATEAIDSSHRIGEKTKKVSEEISAPAEKI
jgi:hypothetical protein